MTVRWFSILAVMSGVFAALASVCSKLAFGESVLKNLCNGAKVYLKLDCTRFALLLDYPFRGFMIIMLILSNVLMWALFSKAMSLSPTTVEVTVINTASNFLMSALFGAFVFGETFSLKWYIGVSFIITGLLIIHKSQSEFHKEKKYS